MAESDADRPAAGVVTTEEADRLSEQFRPSWEDDPPTVPREQPPPAPEAEAKAAVPTPAAISRAPVVSVTASTVPRAGPAGKATPGQAAIALNAPKPAPLLGVSPTPAAKDPAPVRGQASDDLDWEIPANPPAATDDLPMQVDVEELPPESKPSGIGQTYKPKDEGAPAVVLGADVEVAEVGAKAQLEAEHRARRAPTIAKLKAIDIPLPAATLAAPELALPMPRRRGYGRLIGLGLVVLLGGAGGAVLLIRASRHAAPSATPSALPATVAPDTAAPPPPVLSAAEPAPTPPAPSAEEPAAPAAATPEPSAPEPAPSDEPKAEKPAAKPPAAKPAPAKPTPVPKPVAAQPKSSPARKPTAGTPKPPVSKSVIVRDNPF